MAKDAMGSIITLAVVGAAAYALYEWLQSQCTTLGSSLYGGTICSFVPGITVAAATAGTTATTPAAVTQTVAMLNNVSRPGQPFQAGDTYQLIISGPPSSAVSGTAQQNSAASSTSSFGSTNSQGQLVITGTYGAGDVGVWSESWTAGSAAPAQLNFSISAAPGVSGIGQMPVSFVNSPPIVIPGQAPTVMMPGFNTGSNRIGMRFIHRGYLPQ